MKLTRGERRVLKVLSEHDEPLFNGTLGALTGLEFDSVVFRRLEKRKLLIGHPFEITIAGRAALHSRAIGE